MIGGDPPNGYPPRGLWVEDVAYDDDVVEDYNNEAEDMQERVPDSATVPGVEDEGVSAPALEVQRQVMEAFDRGDALHLEVGEAGDVLDDDETESDNMDGLEELYDQATTPVFVGSKTSVVSATIVIMNMCTVFRVSNRFTDELLRYLATDLLPQDNKLPQTHYNARQSIRKLGLNYNNIHACPDGCVLFEDEHVALQSCPKCSKSRWIQGSTTISAKLFVIFHSFYV